MMIPLARKSIGIVLLFGFAAGTCSLFLLFGDRLWLHHAAMILLILYLGLALALEYIAKTTSLAGWANWALALPLLILGLGNAIDRQRVMLDLERTGGVGLASDAIERFAEESRSDPESTFAFFPDWGVFMSFEMVTGGQIPLLTDFSPEAALRKLCEGQDALLAIINDKGVVGWRRGSMLSVGDRPKSSFIGSATTCPFLRRSVGAPLRQRILCAFHEARVSSAFTPHAV